MPPSASLPIAIFFYVLFRLSLGVYHAPFFAGFLVGYLMYDTMHYLVHAVMLPTRVGLFLKRQHMRHHFVDSEKNYGVSSPIWDFAFGTFSLKSKKTESSEKN
jgi:sterol desaturase/sphingolipid hydroxylase (fatty acid hydroxylase superfamily)